MKRTRSAWSWMVVAALVLVPSALEAQAQARIHGNVTNSKGEPLAGVQITIKDTETSAVHHATTDKKGTYSIVILDSSRPYIWRLEQPGYQGYEEQFKAPISSNTIKDWQLKTVDEAPAGAVESPQMKAVGVFNQGAEQARSGDSTGAEAKFREALSLDPELTPALVALALIELQRGEAGKAAELAEKAIALDPGDARALKVRHEAYVKLGDKVKAAEALVALEAADPAARAEALYGQGVDAYNAGEMEKARELFESALAADERLAHAHYLLGLSLVGGGDSAGARKHLERFLELAPDHEDAATAREILSYK